MIRHLTAGLLFALGSVVALLPETITLPSYIPHPGAWAESEPPDRPDPWTEAIAGYYFIDRSEAGATDSGRTYGYPGAARLTVPNPIPAGSYVEIAGAYVTGTKTITAAGDSGSWVAGTSGPAWLVTCPTNQATFDDTTRLRGSYLYVKGLKGWNDRSNGESAVWDISMSDSPPTIPHHILLKSVEGHGDGIHRTTGFVTTGSASGSISNLVLLHCNATNHGDMDTLADEDAFGYASYQYTDTQWFLWCNSYKTVGSTVRLGGEPRISQWRIFVHGGIFGLSREHGIWLKECGYCIISHTTNYLTIEAPEGAVSAGPGPAMGGQYAAGTNFFINNYCYSNIYGWRNGGMDDGAGGNKYVLIGNVFRDNSYGFTKGGGVSLDVFNNTFLTSTNEQISDGGITSGDLRLCNNLIYGRTDGSKYDIEITGNADSDTTISNCLVYPASGSARIRWGASTYTVAQLISNTATGDNSIEQDPLLTATFGLGDGSPAIGAGLEWAELPTNPWDTIETVFGVTVTEQDRLGTAWPTGDMDIGAYEYSPGSRRATVGGGMRLRNGRW